jgi:hypothetical protein
METDEQPTINIHKPMISMHHLTFYLLQLSKVHLSHLQTLTITAVGLLLCIMTNFITAETHYMICFYH